MKGQAKRAYPVWVFAPGAAVAAACSLYIPPGESVGLYPGVFLSGLEYAQPSQGLWHLRDFVIVAISPILLAVGFIFLLVGQLSGAGIRALLLSCAWIAWMVWVGGDSLPFGLAYLPVMPLMCLVIQETIVAALDTYRPSMEAASWVTLFVTAFAAASASKFPGDVGPLSLQRPHTRWLKSKSVAPLGEDTILGRTQLHSEIRHSYYMRLVAEFLDEHAAPGTSLLSPWVGHLSFRTDLRVFDWFGRMRSREGQRMRTIASNTLGARLDHALAQEPDIVFPGLAFGIEMEESSMWWGVNPRLLSMASRSSGVRKFVRDTLRDDYSLLSLPIRHPSMVEDQPYFIYCKRSNAPQSNLVWDATREDPWLWIEFDAPNAEANSKAVGLPQMVDLLVTAEDSQGLTYWLSPSGAWNKLDDTGENSPERSLRHMVLEPVCGERVCLFRVALTQNTKAPMRLTKLHAQLFNSGVRTTHPLAKFGSPAAWSPDQ